MAPTTTASVPAASPLQPAEDALQPAKDETFIEGDIVLLGALKVRPATEATVVKVHPRRLTVRLENSEKLIKVKMDNCTKVTHLEKLQSEGILASPRVPSPTSIMQHVPETPPPATVGKTSSRLTSALTTLATIFGAVVGLVEARAAGISAR